jgi:hypothetical protein
MLKENWIKHMNRQITLTAAELAQKICPCCGASLEIISGHWLLRDCALCAWCRRWYALPNDDPGSEITFSKTIEVLPSSDRKPEKGS